MDKRTIGLHSVGLFWFSWELDRKLSLTAEWALFSYTCDYKFVYCIKKSSFISLHRSQVIYLQ